jgi:hypothetical protein
MDIAASVAVPASVLLVEAGPFEVDLLSVRDEKPCIVRRERLLSSRERESGFLFFTENGHALGHFLERSTQIDVALQQSALISRQALTAPARQWRSAANLEQYNGRGDSMTG